MDKGSSTEKVDFLQGDVPGAPATWRDGWLATIAGAWLLFLIGPLKLILHYPYPQSEWYASGALADIYLGLVIVSSLVGLIVGIWRRFPRWSFPYLGALLFLCSAPLIMAVPDVFPALENSSAFVQVGILAFSWMVSVIVLILLAVYWKPLKPLGLTIQRDWTQLSFATTILIAWLFIDPDDDPSLAVWLPALLIFVAAVGYMRSRTRAQELLALAGSLGTMVLVGLLYRDWYYAIFTLQIALAVLLPALLLLRERSARLPAT